MSLIYLNKWHAVLSLGTDGEPHPSRNEMQQAQMLADIVLAPQTRIYVGPIEDHTTGDDLQLQFAQYGPIVGVSRLGGRQVCTATPGY